MKKYAYKVENIRVGSIGFFNDSKKQTKQLDDSGEDGWELVTISTGKKYLKYVYCRELAEGEPMPKSSSSNAKPATPLQRYITAMVLFAISMVTKIFSFNRMFAFSLAVVITSVVLAVAVNVLFFLRGKSPAVEKAFVVVSLISTILFVISAAFMVF